MKVYNSMKGDILFFAGFFAAAFAFCMLVFLISNIAFLVSNILNIKENGKIQANLVKMVEAVKELEKNNDHINSKEDLKQFFISRGLSMPEEKKSFFSRKTQKYLKAFSLDFDSLQDFLKKVSKGWEFVYYDFKDFKYFNLKDFSMPILNYINNIDESLFPLNLDNKNNIIEGISRAIYDSYDKFKTNTTTSYNSRTRKDEEIITKLKTSEEEKALLAELKIRFEPNASIGYEGDGLNEKVEK